MFFITSIRNFDSQRDYYYVQDLSQFVPKNLAKTSYFRVNVDTPDLGFSIRPLTGTRILFTEPDTTDKYESSYTNTKSYTFGGTVGYSGVQGLNAQASGSYTIGTSTTTTVPAVIILNKTNLTNATPRWEFIPANFHNNVLYAFETSYIWYIDRATYEKNADYNNSKQVQSRVYAKIEPETEGPGYSAVCNWPQPFSTWQIDAPVITSVEPTSVASGGGAFLIHGRQMYSGIVSSVLLGGDALSNANFIPLNESEIRVVVPSSQNPGPTPVQLNTTVQGKTMHSNSDVTVNIE